MLYNPRAVQEFAVADRLRESLEVGPRRCRALLGRCFGSSARASWALPWTRTRPGRASYRGYLRGTHAGDGD